MKAELNLEIFLKKRFLILKAEINERSNIRINEYSNFYNIIHNFYLDLII